MLDLKKINELMTEREIRNYKALSKESSIPYTTLCYMLKGHDLYLKNLVKLCNFFNVHLDYLLNNPCGFVIYSNSKVVYTKISNIYELVYKYMV